MISFDKLLTGVSEVTAVDRNAFDEKTDVVAKCSIISHGFVTP